MRKQVTLIHMSMRTMKERLSPVQGRRKQEQVVNMDSEIWLRLGGRRQSKF